MAKEHFPQRMIDINDILLDMTNPRHEPLTAQHQIISWFMSNTQERNRLLRLAADIAEHGLNPAEQVIVIPHNKDSYTVVEGNRRIAALKCLLEPDKCGNATWIKRFRKLANEATVSLPTKITCVLAKDRAEAAHWIDIKHRGQQEGAGLVGWGPREVARRDLQLGNPTKYALARRIEEYAVDEGLVPEEDIEGTTDISTTDRFFRYKEVKGELGVDLDDSNQLKRSVDKRQFNNFLRAAFYAMAKSDFNVDKVRTAEKAEQVFESMKAAAGIDKFKHIKPRPAIKKKVAVKKKVRVKRSSGARKQLIPTSFQARVEESRLNNVYRELKNTAIKNHENMVAMGFRLLLDIGLYHYLDVNKLNVPTTGKRRPTIEQYTQVVLKHMQDNGLLKQAETKPVRKIVSDKGRGFMTIDSLHDYCHGPYAQPSESDLKTMWDNIEPFMKVLLHREQAA